MLCFFSFVPHFFFLFGYFLAVSGEKASVVKQNNENSMALESESPSQQQLLDNVLMIGGEDDPPKRLNSDWKDGAFFDW